MGSLFAGASANSQANAANRTMNAMGGYGLMDNMIANNAEMNFQSQMFGQYQNQFNQINSLAGPAVTDFHLQAMPGVATSPTGDQTTPKVARSWLGGN